MVNVISSLKHLSQRCKKVRLLATQQWGVGNFPKRNTPEMKAQ